MELLKQILEEEKLCIGCPMGRENLAIKTDNTLCKECWIDAEYYEENYGNTI